MTLKLYFYLILFVAGKCFSASLAEEPASARKPLRATLELKTSDPKDAHNRFQAIVEDMRGNKNNPFLSVLSLEVKFFDNWGHPDLAFDTFFYRIPNLTSLTIAGNCASEELRGILRSFTDGPKSVESLRAPTDITELCLQNMIVNDEAMRAVASFLKRTKLQSLTFKGCEFRMQSFVGQGALWALLPHNKTLKNLSFSHWTGEAAKTMERVLSSFQKRSHGLVADQAHLTISVEKKDEGGKPCQASFQVTRQTLKEKGESYDVVLRSMKKEHSRPSEEGSDAETVVGVPLDEKREDATASPPLLGAEAAPRHPNVAGLEGGDTPVSWRNAPPSPRGPTGERHGSSLTRVLDHPRIKKPIPSHARGQGSSNFVSTDLNGDEGSLV